MAKKLVLEGQSSSKPSRWHAEVREYKSHRTFGNQLGHPSVSINVCHDDVTTDRRVSVCAKYASTFSRQGSATDSCRISAYSYPPLSICTDPTIQSRHGMTCMPLQYGIPSSPLISYHELAVDLARPYDLISYHKVSSAKCVVRSFGLQGSIGGLIGSTSSILIHPPIA